MTINQSSVDNYNSGSIIKSSKKNKSDGDDDDDDDKQKNKRQQLLLRRPFVLLTILVVQNSTAALVGRYTRSGRPKNELFSINNFLLVCEVSKLFLSLVLEYFHQKHMHKHKQIHTQQLQQNDEDEDEDEEESPPKTTRTTSVTNNDDDGNSHMVERNLLLLLLRSLRVHVLEKPIDTMRLILPAILFLASNTFRYIAQGYLPVPTFQVIVQSRLVTTAIWSVFLFYPQRTYTCKQWICLGTTTFGLILVVLGQTSSSATNNNNNSNNNNHHQKLEEKDDDDNAWIGILSLLGASFLSSAASVYLEKIYKAKAKAKNKSIPKKITTLSHSSKIPTTTIEEGEEETHQLQPIQQHKEEEPSLWIRNIQLSCFSILIASIQNLLVGSTNYNYNDQSKPFFYGFHPLVWLQVLLFSFGGVLVAAVTKYSDSVLKGLATAISMLLSSILSMVVLERTPIRFSNSFVVGATTIITSVYLFSNPWPRLRIIDFFFCCYCKQARKKNAARHTRLLLLLLMLFLMVFCVVRVLFLQSRVLLMQQQQQQDGSPATTDYWILLQSSFNQKSTATDTATTSERSSKQLV